MRRRARVAAAAVAAAVFALIRSPEIAFAEAAPKLPPFAEVLMEDEALAAPADAETAGVAAAVAALAAIAQYAIENAVTISAITDLGMMYTLASDEQLNSNLIRDLSQGANLNNLVDTSRNDAVWSNPAVAFQPSQLMDVYASWVVGDLAWLQYTHFGSDLDSGKYHYETTGNAVLAQYDIWGANDVQECLLWQSGTNGFYLVWKFYGSVNYGFHVFGWDGSQWVDLESGNMTGGWQAFYVPGGYHGYAVLYTGSQSPAFVGYDWYFDSAYGLVGETNQSWDGTGPAPGSDAELTRMQQHTQPDYETIEIPSVPLNTFPQTVYSPQVIHDDSLHEDVFPTVASTPSGFPALTYDGQTGIDPSTGNQEPISNPGTQPSQQGDPNPYQGSDTGTQTGTGIDWLDTIVQWLERIVNDLEQGLETGINNVEQAVQDGSQQIATTIEALPQQIGQAIQPIIQPIQQLMPQIVGQIEALPESIGEAVRPLTSPIEDTVKTIEQDLEAPPEEIDWSPLKNLPVSTKFPFSLPWDLADAIQTLQASPSLPDYTIAIDGASATLHWPDFLEQIVPLIRDGELIVFNIALIFAMRRLMGGDV